MKTLLISTCRHKLSEGEFVRPLEEIMKKFGKVIVKRYYEHGIDNADRIVISGTALKDFDYVNYLDRFKWLKTTKVPVFGICAGYQIILSIFDEKLVEKKIIEARNVNKKLYFLTSLVGKELRNFNPIWKMEDIPIFIKHKTLPIYATAFHPEVFNKELLENFIRTGRPI